MMKRRCAWVMGMISVGALVCTSAGASSVAVVGLFKDKALISIDGGKPRMIAVGQTIQGVRLLAADSERASLDVAGTRRVLAMGQSFAGAAPEGRRSVTLSADARGHFAAAGSANGYPLTFLVDTGATAVVISAADARRMGIDYKSGSQVGVNTAAGLMPAWRHKFNSVKIGQLEVLQVEGMVVEAGLSMPLLGMSFLNRMEMAREGQTMVLRQRY